MSAVETTPPKPVQRCSADDYARNGRLVSELVRIVLDLLAPKPGERLDLGYGDGVFTIFEQFQEPRTDRGADRSHRAAPPLALRFGRTVDRRPHPASLCGLSLIHI